MRTAPDPDDIAAIAAVVRNAKVLGHYVVVSIYTHEGGVNRTTPADFLIEFAHALIDAGADVMVGHGPHVLRGVEIYNGKPVLYSLGDFIFQNGDAAASSGRELRPIRPRSDGRRRRLQLRAVPRRHAQLPADPEIWEGAIAMPSFQGGELVELRLLPVTLGFSQPPSVRARPLRPQGSWPPRSYRT